MIILWHNPRCSKSRATLALLEGQELSIRKYLDDPPRRDEIQDTAVKLGLAPSQMVRTSEKLFRELGLKQASDDALLAAMAAHPILIERPIAIRGDSAVIGRPPERVLDLITGR